MNNILKNINKKIFIIMELVENYIKKTISYNFNDLGDAFLSSSLILIVLKIVTSIVNIELHPQTNLFLLLILFILSLTYCWIWFIREYLLINFLKKYLGFNFYRYNIYDSISDFDSSEYMYYKKTKLGKFMFYKDCFIRIFIRKLYLLLIFLRLIINYFSIFSMMLQQILFIYLIFNKLLLIMYILLFFILLSKILLLLTDIRYSNFMVNLNKNFNIDLDSVILPTLNNAYLIMFWSIRSLENREEYLFDLSCPNYEYIEEKIYTHNLDSNIKITKKKFNWIFLFPIVIIFIFVVKF